MARPPLSLPKLVWVLLASAILTLIVARTLPPVILNGVNYINVAHILLVTSFGLFGLTILEVAITYIPSLVSAQWVLLVVLIGFTIFAGRTWLRLGDWLPSTYPQPNSTGIPSPIFSSDQQSAPTSTPQSSLQSAENPPQNTPKDNPSSLPPLRLQPPDNPDAPPPSPHPQPTTANPQQPGDAKASNHPLPAFDAPKLPAITLAQRNTIRDAMRPYAGLRFTLLRINPTNDSRSYAGQIETALTSAGLINSSDQDAAANPGAYPAGLSLIVGDRQSDAADRLSSAMHRAGLVTWAVPISESSNRQSFQLIVAPN